MIKKYYSAEELKQLLNSEEWIKAHAKTLASTFARLKR